MKRIIIICEGETEQDFCKDVLYAHFIGKGILIEHPIIKKSNGGIVAWDSIQKQVENHLAQDRAAFVTTLIDYYGTLRKHQFPNWDESLRIADKNSRMNFLESAMMAVIDEAVRFRFLPYIQLHEFEGLLFNNIQTFRQQLPPESMKDERALEKVITNFPNPELINDKPADAPSKRLERLISGYRKTIYGPILAEAIGLHRIREKCPRFHEWITKLENI